MLGMFLIIAYNLLQQIKYGKKKKRSGCAVFEGNIVVSGGWSNNDRSKLNTVESYDFNANKWLSMQKMIHRHNYHNLVVAIVCY